MSSFQFIVSSPTSIATFPFFNMGQYDMTLGLLLVGIFINTYLYGIVTYQFAAYWKTPFNDRRIVRLMVFFLFVLDTVHSAAVMYMAWVYCVTNFNNPAILLEALWPYCFTPPATAAAALVTQTFLGYRVYRMLNSNRLVYGAIVFIAMVSFVLGVYCGTRAWIIHFSVKLVVLNKPVIAWLSIQAGLDLTITCLLTYALVRSKTGFRRTDSAVNRLIRGAIQTGVFAAAFALGDLFTFLYHPNTNYYGMFAIPIGRIYTNTLLDTLLTRESLRHQLGPNTFSSNDCGLGGLSRNKRSSTLQWAHPDLSTGVTRPGPVALTENTGQYSDDHTQGPPTDTTLSDKQPSFDVRLGRDVENAYDDKRI